MSKKNNFDSLEWIIDAFEEKHGDERKIKAKVNENDKDLIKGLTQMIKDMQLNQAQLIKNKELNETRLIQYHAKEMSTMEVNHSSQMVALQNRLLALGEKQLINTMETNHAKKISVMKANQITFQNKLDEMERLQVQKSNLG